MERLWEAERAEGSELLRLARSSARRRPADRPRPPRRALGALAPKSRSRQRRCSTTSSRLQGRRSRTASRDLAEYAGVGERELEPVLTTLDLRADPAPRAATATGSCATRSSTTCSPMPCSPGAADRQVSASGWRRHGATGASRRRGRRAPRAGDQTAWRCSRSPSATERAGRAAGPRAGARGERAARARRSGAPDSLALALRRRAPRAGRARRGRAAAGAGRVAAARSLPATARGRVAAVLRRRAGTPPRRRRRAAESACLRLAPRAALAHSFRDSADRHRGRARARPGSCLSGDEDGARHCLRRLRPRARSLQRRARPRGRDLGRLRPRRPAVAA